MPCADAGDENRPFEGAAGDDEDEIRADALHLREDMILRRRPTDMRMMTDAMPMTMPSIVSTERILPCVRLRVAVLNASRKSMII